MQEQHSEFFVCSQRRVLVKAEGGLTDPEHGQFQANVGGSLDLSRLRAQGQEVWRVIVNFNNLIIKNASKTNNLSLTFKLGIAQEVEANQETTQVTVDSESAEESEERPEEEGRREAVVRGEQNNEVLKETFKRVFQAEPSNLVLLDELRNVKCIDYWFCCAEETEREEVRESPQGRVRDFQIEFK